MANAADADDADADDLVVPSVAAEFLKAKPETLASWRSRRTGPPWIQVSPRMPRYSLRALRQWLAARVVAGEGRAA